MSIHAKLLSFFNLKKIIFKIREQKEMSCPVDEIEITQKRRVKERETFSCMPFSVHEYTLKKSSALFKLSSCLLIAK